MLFPSNMPGPAVRSRLLPPMMVIALLMTGMLVSPACSQQTSEPAPAAGEDAATRIGSIGFEVFEEGTPAGMEPELGAETGEAGIENGIHRDTEVFRSGESSLRIEGDAETHIWYSLGCLVPDDAVPLSATYSVRGESIRREAEQFENCYVGFRYIDAAGRWHSVKNRYEGSFDWQQDTLRLAPEEEGVHDIRFLVFHSMSGALWVDDVDFESTAD